MLWVQKLKTDIREVVKGHPVSIVMFLLGCTGLGVYQDLVDSNPVTFFYMFMFSLAPCFVLLEAGFGRIREKRKLKGAAVFFAVFSLAISFAYSYMNGFMHNEATVQGGKWFYQYTYLSRLFVVYICFSVLGSVFLMYKSSGLFFEKYTVRAFLGVMKASLLYGVVALGVLSILYVFDALIHDIDVVLLIEMIVAGAVGFPAFLMGLSRVDGEITRFSRALMGYVLPGILAVSCLIVYFYIFKIIIIRSFPSNEAFTIMTSIFMTGLFIWTAAQGCTEGTLQRLLKLFPFVFAPFIIVQIITLAMRIGQYGITTERYFGIMLIALEIVYVGCYAFLSAKGEGIRGILFLLFFAVVLIFYLVPGINVYSVVVRSQRAVVEKYLDDMTEGGDSLDISLARARSALRAIRDEGSIEGLDYADTLKDRYSEELVSSLENRSGVTYDDGQESLYVSAYNSEPVVDVKDYSYMKVVGVSINYGEIDPGKLPVYESYNTAKRLTYVDLSQQLKQLKELEQEEADIDQKQEVINGLIILDNNSALWINSLDFEINGDGKVSELSFSGFYLYKYE